MPKATKKLKASGRRSGGDDGRKTPREVIAKANRVPPNGRGFR